MTKRKNSAAVALGRRGGMKRVPKGFSVLTTEQRKAIAKKAAAARWGHAKVQEAIEGRGRQAGAEEGGAGEEVNAVLDVLRRAVSNPTKPCGIVLPSWDA